MAMELIETIEVGSGGASSIEFTSIPQDGVDLLLMFSGRDTSTTENAKITLNSDGGSNYPTVTLDGNGSSASSSGFTGTRLRGLQGQSSYTSNTFGSVSIYISNYTSTTISPTSDYHVVVPSETISIRIQKGHNRIPVAGYIIEIVGATTHALEYRIVQRASAAPNK